MSGEILSLQTINFICRTQTIMKMWRGKVCSVVFYHGFDAIDVDEFPLSVRYDNFKARLKTKRDNITNG